MMKFYYKLISSIMILSLLLPISVYASDSVRDKYPVFTDTSSMSDEIFFGEWDEEREVWKTKGKLNYEAFPELAETERFVKLGSYDAAKEALFDYYKNREGFGRQEPYSAVDDRMVYLTLHDMYNFQEQYIASAIIEGPEYRCYEIELSNIVNGAPDTAKGTFMIAAADKSMDIVGISSKEGPAELRPILRFYRKNGTIYELPVIRDSYTRAYNNEVSYETENYGKETELLVKDDFYETTSGLYSPFGANTRETYIQFDSSKILSNEDINGATLVFYARLLPEDGCELEGTTKEIMIFNSYNKTWKEYKGDTATGPVLTWKDISHTHYSYNGLPGGFNWTKPDGAHSQWMFYNSRFFQVSSMINSYLKTSDENYIYKAIEFVLDFIKDGYAGLPNNDIEPGNRSLVLPIAIQYFMDSPFMNPDALIAMLKYMWEEAEYLRMDSSYIHPENNRGLWHTAGFHRIASYYPEFTNCAEWWEVIDKRLDDSIKLLVKEDGCYTEATNSYPKTVAEFLYEIYENCILTGREIPELLLPRLRDLAKYIMYVSYPTGTPNFWGEGGPGNMRSFVKQVGELLEDEELIFFGTKGSDGTEPAYTTKAFDYLKVVTSRTDWSTEAYMLWMNAKNGSNHNHKDSLHLTLYAKDQEVLKDTGMTSYDGSHPHFQWQRHTTRSHNTIEIDEIAQRGSATINDEENGESSIQVDTNARTDKITAWTDATKNFRHFRDVTFLKDLKLVIVSDMVQPSDEFEHKYTQNWHSQPFCNAEIDPVTKVGSTHIGEGSNIIIAQSRPEDTVATLEHGYDVYPADTEYFCYTQNKAGNVAYDTVLLPVEEGVDMNLAVENMETDADPTIASAMQISMFKNDEPRKNVIYYQSRGDNVATHTFGDYSANAETAVMSLDVDGMMETLDVFGAKELKKGGQIIFKSEDELADLSVNFNGSALELYSSDDKIKQTAFQIAVPKNVKKVTLNGHAVGYIYANNQVYVNTDNLENVLLSDGIVYSSEISTADGSYTVTVKIPAETSVVSGSFTLPTCTADGEDIKISFADNTLSLIHI